MPLSSPGYRNGACGTTAPSLRTARPGRGCGCFALAGCRRRLEQQERLKSWRRWRQRSSDSSGINAPPLRLLEKWSASQRCGWWHGSENRDGRKNRPFIGRITIFLIAACARVYCASGRYVNVFRCQRRYGSGEQFRRGIGANQLVSQARPVQRTSFFQPQFEGNRQAVDAQVKRLVFRVGVLVSDLDHCHCAFFASCARPAARCD